MRPFTFLQPDTLEEVFDLLAQHGEEAHLIAGGTALVLLMQQDLVQPEAVISLRKIPGMSGVSRTADGGLEIGALATHRQAEMSGELGAYDGALAEAFGHVATVRIRNIGTVGGNLAHADPSQDPPPMLMALDAQVTLASKSGQRSVPLDEFFTDYFETCMQPGEVLKSIRLPRQPEGLRSHYVKFLPRSADDYATVAVATTLGLSDGVVSHARIGLGSAAPVPLRCKKAEQALTGQRLTPALIGEVAEMARQESDPLDDVRGSSGYKKDMVAVWVRRSLEKLAA